ncbi:MAG TPA: M13 family metallopeptidase N-terminal domain-containing protein, partial [Thermoanaerobaculia bacterium]
MRRISTLLLILFIAGCASAPTNNQPATGNQQPATSNHPLFGAHGFDLTAMDTTANACENFYQFAVGNWRKQNPLPAEYSRFGRFEQVAERNRQTLRAILEDASKNPNPPGSAAQKIGDFYAACMNEPAIEAAGSTPIANELSRIEAINDRAALQNEIFDLQRSAVAPVFAFSGQNDQKNSRMIIAVVSQGGLGMPDRDYYLRNDAKFTSTRQQYVEHVARMLQLTGEEPARASADADRIIGLETQLARAQVSRIELRDPEKRYNITPVAQLSSIAPNVNWPAMLQT